MSTREILIIPDIHGRAFFRDALSEALRNNTEVVCLGDYLDPYEEDGITNEEAFTIMEEVVEAKKARPHMVHLLIGNHDSSYLYAPEMCPSRFDYVNAQRNHEFFMKNSLYFDLFYDTHIAGKRFLFSHAGITSGWLSELGYSLQGIDEALMSLKKEYMEYCLDNSKTAIWGKLSYVSKNRGGRNENGSMIWADFFEHTDYLNWLKDNAMAQIVGHTQLNFHPVRVSDRLFCLDCGETFYIDRDGIIRSWRTGASVMNTDNFVSLKHDCEIRID